LVDLIPQGLNEETGNFKEVYEKKDVLAWHKALQNCTLTSRDFKDTFEFIDKDSYVFLDPPYRQLPDEKKQKKPQVKKEKLQYGVSFDDKLQESVLDYFNSAKEKGAYVLLSNRDVGDGFFEKRLRNNKIHPIEVTYTAGRRKKTENGFEAKKAKEILMY
jgi:DNA adenine methylase